MVNSNRYAFVIRLARLGHDNGCRLALMLRIFAKTKKLSELKARKHYRAACKYFSQKPIAALKHGIKICGLNLLDSNYFSETEKTFFTRKIEECECLSLNKRLSAFYLAKGNKSKAQRILRACKS